MTQRKAWNSFPRPKGDWQAPGVSPTLRKLCEMAAGVRGSLFAHKFYRDAVGLQSFLDAPGTDAEKAEIIRTPYQMLEQRDGHDYAQAFVTTWLTFSRVVVGVDRYKLNHPKTL